MKKIIVIISILFFSVGSVFSQYLTPHFASLDKFRVLDSAYLKCTYRFMHVQDSLNVDKTSKVDIQTLLVGKKISKYFSQYMADYCLYTNELFKKGAQSVPNNREEGTCGFEIYKNYPDKKTTVTDLGNILGGNFLYEEESSNLKWDIKSDTSTILLYSCQKAIATFRGRKYEAWFTADIPINNGPWKFGGLPGLILKIYDLKQFFVFECIGLEKLKTNEPIKFYDLKYTKTVRKNLDKLYRRFHYDAAAYHLSNGIKCYTQTPTGKWEQKMHSPKMPYNPIELE